VLQGRHLPGIGLHQTYERNSVPQLAHIQATLQALATEEA
jgi:2-oxoisovalerate dehydrogenase E1 component beta subunit